MIERLTQLYGEDGIVTKENILEILKSYNPDISEVSLRKKIMQLCRKGLLQIVKQGIYTLKVKPDYQFEPNQKLIRIRRIFTKIYPDIPYCIWSTDVLNHFMIHQSFKNIIIFEVEKEMLEIIFHLFSDHNLNVFLTPDERTMGQYVTFKESPIIIKPLISKSPVKIVKKCRVPRIEKILVDTFCDRIIFNLYQGSEMQNIFNFSDKSVSINYSTLISYAHARSRKKEIIRFLQNNTKIKPIKYL